LLPAFLEDLKANGFSVARLAPGSSAVDAPLVAAAGPIAIPQ
jgi:hypothetical protein